MPPIVLWSGDGRWIYFRALIDGRIDVWRAAADGSGTEPLTRDDADVRAFSLSADGRTLKFSVGPTREEVRAAEQAEYDDGIRLDRSTPIGQPLFRSGYTEGRLATQRLGLMFNRVALTAKVPDHWKELDLTTRETRDLPQSDIPPVSADSSDLAKGIADVWKMASDPDSSRIALLTRSGERTASPRIELIMVPRKGARAVKCMAKQCTDQEITGIQWRPGSNEVLFTGQFYPARSAGKSPSPLFITYYRCMGFVRGGSGDEWPLATLAEKGISTLCINAPSFSSNAAERYGTGLSAVQSAIALLSSEQLIDRTKVGMGGLSFGAEVTMWTLIHSDLIAAASTASPTTSQQYYLLGSNIGADFTSLLKGNWQLGPPPETSDRWKEISPASNLSRIVSPILMQFAEQEYMYGLDYEIPMMLGRKADIYVFPNEPHNKFQPRHKLAVYERNLDWFRFWLQDYENPAPEKAEQYTHWREMRAAGSRQANPD